MHTLANHGDLGGEQCCLDGQRNAIVDVSSAALQHNGIHIHTPRMLTRDNAQILQKQREQLSLTSNNMGMMQAPHHSM